MNSVIIGSNFGDEGKGLITDFETRRLNASTVVRFNGGSQAGHTVNFENKKHVFGHVGAGTFAGADTYLSSDFIVCPEALQSELKMLKQYHIAPIINVHPDARVTTVFDILINIAVEQYRGLKKQQRHGSCLMGINETVTRHLAGENNEFDIQLTVRDIFNLTHDELVLNLKNIHTYWVRNRIKELGIKLEYLDKSISDALETPDLEFMATKLAELKNLVTLDIPKPFKAVLEGAQGLLLDEHLGFFPHVTRSLTGLPNALKAASELSLTEVDPVYVTRAYCTRHGAGPLKNDGVKFSDEQIVDSTNVYGFGQGQIRFAPLDIIALKHNIDLDLARSRNNNIKINTPTIAVTCLDQVGESVIVDVGALITIRTEDLCSLISILTGYEVSHESWGPTAADVKYCK